MERLGKAVAVVTLVTGLAAGVNKVVSASERVDLAEARGKAQGAAVMAGRDGSTGQVFECLNRADSCELAADGDTAAELDCLEAELACLQPTEGQNY